MNRGSKVDNKSYANMGQQFQKGARATTGARATCSKSNDKANSLSTRQGHKGLVVQGASKTSEWLGERRKHERNGEESYTEQIPSAWPSTGMRVDSLIMRTSWLEPRGMTNCPHLSTAATNNKLILTVKVIITHFFYKKTHGSERACVFCKSVCALLSLSAGACVSC